jgi:mono/diheme cytochrome c family protein
MKAQVLVIALLVAGSVSLAVAQSSTSKGDPEAAKIKNPVTASPDSIKAGEKTYATACASCHGRDAKGGVTLSVIEDRGGNQPPDLVDDKWDHGSSDGEIYSVIKKGIGPDFFMAPFDGRITDTEMWNVVNYLRSLSPAKK